LNLYLQLLQGKVVSGEKMLQSIIDKCFNLCKPLRFSGITL